MHPLFQMKLWHVDRDNSGEKGKKEKPNPKVFFFSPLPLSQYKQWIYVSGLQLMKPERAGANSRSFD